MKPEDILPTYELVGARFAATRNTSLWEAPLLDWLLAESTGPALLDIGCGGGVPIARYLVQRGAEVTAIDGAQSMVAACRQAVPEAKVLRADMRDFNLGQRFDGMIAFNSFFHLSPDDQERAFACFSDHAGPGAPLIFTSGPDASEKIGSVEGHPVYHASLSPQGYRTLFKRYGWEEIAFDPESKRFHGHSVWQIKRNRSGVG